jgi:hypothetical protein
VDSIREDEGYRPVVLLPMTVNLLARLLGCLFDDHKDLLGKTGLYFIVFSYHNVKYMIFIPLSLRLLFVASRTLLCSTMLMIVGESPEQYPLRPLFGPRRFLLLLMQTFTVL